MDHRGNRGRAGELNIPSTSATVIENDHDIETLQQCPVCHLNLQRFHTHQKRAHLHLHGVNHECKFCRRPYRSAENLMYHERLCTSNTLVQTGGSTDLNDSDDIDFSVVESNPIYNRKF